MKIIYLTKKIDSISSVQIKQNLIPAENSNLVSKEPAKD